MCDQTEISYSDEEVVWVKLGNCWWPGEVVAPEKLSPDILRSCRKPPIAIVKFFQEDAYEFVKNINSIYKYQCSRKHEFINKGLSLYRTKHGHMEKFPEDVIRAETKLGGDIEILTRDEFQETKKESYAGLFGTPAKKTPASIKKGRGRPAADKNTPVRQMKEKTDYKVHILVQGSKTNAPVASPSTSAEQATPSTSTAAERPATERPSTEEPISSEPQSDAKLDNVEKPVSTIQTPATPSTPSSSSGIYACHACSFTTTRLNVLILHNKSHSVSFMPYIPTPVKKKPVLKTPVKSTPAPTKTPKQRKPRKEKVDKPAKTSNKKRSSQDKVSEVENKKLKTDEEIKSSLLADWDDDDADDESNDESATAAAQSPEVPLGAQSPEVPLGAESPAVPTPAELPAAQVPSELSSVPDNKANSSPQPEKPEASSESNKFDFCEDEDWPVEADAGRKIPRVKNPVRTDETKSISIDEDDMAREVAELLNKTAVPELPSVPEPLKAEENFPEPSVAKSPDKKLDQLPSTAPDGTVPEIPPTRAIFKTKTFFRSRHSRSQDAIGKYVAEQLNNVEKMDIADCDLNGSDNVSSPEARDSPPIEHFKVARLAPKIQLKRMKAEAQMREKERNRLESSPDPYNMLSDIMMQDDKPESPLEKVKEKEHFDTMSFSMSSQNVIYPTSEIVPFTETDPSTTGIKEVPSTNYDAEMDASNKEIKEVPSPNYDAEMDALTKEIKEVPSPNYDSEMDASTNEIKEMPSPNYDAEMDASTKEIKEVPSPNYDAEMDASTTEIKDVPSPNYDAEMDASTKETKEVPSPNYDASTEGEDTCETVIEENHKYTEESESSQEAFGIELSRENAEKAESHQDIVEEEVQVSEILYQENINKSIEPPGISVPEQMLSGTPEPVEEEEPVKPAKPYMNESTASAVDALLSVSRDADRVTRTISDDPPEDLFEDDNKDESINSDMNGETNHTIATQQTTVEQVIFPDNEQEGISEDKEKEPNQMFSSYEENSALRNEDSEEIMQSENEVDSYIQGLHKDNDNDKHVLPVDEEPETNEKLDNDGLITHVDEISVTQKVFDKNVFDNEGGNKIAKQSVFPENEEIITTHNELNKSAFLDNDAMPAVHEVTKNDVFPENEIHIPETHEETEHIMIHSGFSENEEEIITTQESELASEESTYLQHEEEVITVQDETEIQMVNNPDEYIAGSVIYQNEEVVTTPHNSSLEKEGAIYDSPVENMPSESDLQIAEALINLPATALQNQTPQEQTENQQNHLMSNSFELDTVQEEIIQASDDDTNSLEKTNESTNNIEEQSFNPNDESVNVRFETEQEKCENLNAAQSLLHMSASIEHTISIPEPMDINESSESLIQNAKQNNGTANSIEQNMAKISNEIISEPEKMKKPFLTSSSKLLQILEEPSKPRFTATKITPTKQILMRGKEKILNFDVAKSSFKSKPNSQNQKIIIRRTTPSKTVLSNISELPSQDKIILSRSNTSQEGSSVQRFTIQTTPDAPSDANTIIIQQKIRKLSKPPTKIQKIKHHTLVTPTSEAKPIAESSSVDNTIFDINSMPIVLSEDLITAESIEKMPVVMSNANISPVITQPSQPKTLKQKINITENEKITVTSVPKKQETKTLLMNSVNEVQNKSTTPNILSKSTKLRAAKPMIVIDKTTGKQKIIMTKAEPTIKEVKQIQKTPTLLQKSQSLVQKTTTLIQKTSLVQKSPNFLHKAPSLVQKTQTLVQKTPTLIQTTPTLIQTTPTLIQTTPTLIQTTPTLLQNAPTLIQAIPQTAKQTSQGDKFIILPTQNPARSGRTQKIVIDPQTGKAHMILSRGKEASTTNADNKPVSAKLVPSKSETNAPGNTVMIITNAQGAQSRIVLTPEHEKILFPNKQQQKGSQLKTIAHRITTGSPGPQLKTVLNPTPMRQIVAAAKTPTRIVPKQKNAIITSKGQLIVGGRVATTAQNIAPMPEPRPAAAKRLTQPEPRKLAQAAPKASSEPIIYLQQKSGAVMQLTASQFEQLQRTGQIVQKAAPAPDRLVAHKPRAAEPSRPRARRAPAAESAPAKRAKLAHEVPIAPAPLPARREPAMPALAPLAPAAPPAPPAPVAPSTSGFSEFDNFEEMLPSTAIARQPAAAPEPASPAPAAPAPPAAEPAGAALADGQLLAVPGEHFGGPVGSFYLCVEEHGTYTPIDNRPLVLENNQLMPMAEAGAPPAVERRDILSAALANSDVFHADAPDAPDFRDLNANVSVHCRVSETSTTLHQPIMTPVELPRSEGAEPAPAASLEAVLGVAPPGVPTSLELPITVTDPRIAPRAAPAAPCGTTLMPAAPCGTTLMPSPGAELCYVSAEEALGPISMPLLTEEEEPAGAGASMPILTDELGERAVSSVESLGSPASPEGGAAGGWTRRLLTPGSDSDLSVEIPLQPAIQLSVGDLSDRT